MIKYVVFDNPLKARQLSGLSVRQKDGMYAFKWSYLVSSDNLTSCLILEYKEDYVDLGGNYVIASCEYIEFKNFYKETDYIEYNELPNIFKYDTE